MELEPVERFGQQASVGLVPPPEMYFWVNHDPGESIIVLNLSPAIAAGLENGQPEAAEQVVVASENPGEYFIKTGIAFLRVNRGSHYEMVRITRGQFREAVANEPPDVPAPAGAAQIES